MGKYDDILEKYRKQRDGDTSAEQKQKQTQGNDYSSVLDAYHKSKEGQTQTQGQTQPQVQHSGIYEQRKARQDKASEAAKKAWWEVLGLAAQDASAAAIGQQRTLTAEEGQQRATAGANLAAATKENREANKIIDWDGRKELLKQYEASGGTDMETREKLRQGDIKAGNLDVDGDMAYTLDETVQRVGTGAMGRVASGVYNAAITLGDLYAKGQAMQGPTEQELLVERMTGQELGSTAKMRQQGYNSDSYRNFMNKRYAEASKIGATAQKDLDIAKENKAPVVKAGIDVGENMLEMGFDGAVAALSGGSALIPMAVRVFGSSTMEAREAGASLEQQALYGAGSAAVEVFTEKMGDGLAGLYGKGFADSAMEKLIGKLAKTDNGRTFLRFLSGLNGEGMEEVVSGLFEPALKSIYNGRRLGENYSELELSNLLYDYALGAAAAMFGGVSNIASGGNAYANAQLRAADAAQAQTDSNFGWMLPDSVKGQARDEQFDRMFISGTLNAPTRSAAPAQKPEMKEAKTPAQRRVEAIINAASTQDQLVQSLQFFQSKPELDAAFEELTGIEDLEAYLAEATQEAAGGVVPQAGNPAPAAPESAQQQAPGEFNSANEVGESGEREGDAINPFTVWPNMNYDRIAEAQNRNMRDASAGVDNMNNTGYDRPDYESYDVVGVSRGKEITRRKSAGRVEAERNRQNKPQEIGTDRFNYGRDSDGKASDPFIDDATNSARRRYAEDARIDNARNYKAKTKERINKERYSGGYDSKATGEWEEPETVLNREQSEGNYAELLRTAEQQVNDDWRNVSRIQDGVDEWQDSPPSVDDRYRVTPRLRAQILSDITGDEYYVSGKSVVKASREIESDTDERSDRFYEKEMRDAGVPDDVSAIVQEGDRLSRSEKFEKDFRLDANEPRPEYEGKYQMRYTPEELARVVEENKEARRRDAQRHRENFDAYLSSGYYDPANLQLGDVGERKAVEALVKNITNPAKPPVEGGRLGAARTDIRSNWMQRVMRDRELLGDLVNGTGAFEGFAGANRLDALRTMYPDANWQFDASTNTITLPAGNAEYKPVTQWKTETKGDTSNVESGPQKAGAGQSGKRSGGLDSRTSRKAIEEIPQLGLESAKKNIPGLQRAGHQRHGRLRTRLSELGFTVYDRSKLSGLGKRLSDLCRDVAPECPVTFFSSDGVELNADTGKVFRYGSGFECSVRGRSGGIFIDLSRIEASAKAAGCTPEAIVMHEIGHYFIDESGVDPADIVSAFLNQSSAPDRASVAIFNASNEMAMARFGKSSDQLTPEQADSLWNELISDGFGAVDRCFKSGPLYAQTQFLPFVKFVRNFFNNTDFTATTGDFDLSSATSTISPFASKEEAQQRGDYRLGPKSAAKLDAEAHANTPAIDPYDDGGIDVDADDFELPYRTDSKEMQRREELNKQAEADYRSEPKTETPESSKQYLQQNRLRKSDFENRETERGGTEAQYKAEQAEIREEIEHDEAYDRAQEEGKLLAEMKQAYGEKTQKSLADLAKKVKGLVGSKRLTTSGQRGYMNKDGELVGHVKGDVTEDFSYNEGGKDIESFAHVLGEFAAGRQTFTQLAEAYDKLGSYSEKKKGSYFYDKIFAEQFERLRDALENGDVPINEGALDPKFVRSVEDLTKRVAHRFEYMQNMLKFRSHLAEVYGEGKPFRTKAGALAKALEAAHRFQLRPSTAFKMLSGYDKTNGSAWYELADMARDATKNYINTFQNAQDYLRELTERKGWEDFSTGKTTVKNVIPNLMYDGGRLSANAAVSFLKMLETDGAYDHIIRNGIVEMARTEKELYSGQNNNGFGDATGYSQTFDPISKETRALLDKAESFEDREAARAKAVAELNAIKAALHAEVEACPAAKAFYDASFAPLNFLKKALNKTSRKVWGTDAAVQDKFYWPLEAGGKREGSELLNDHSFGLDQYRNVQARTGDRGGLKVRPATDVMQGYIRSASHWAAYQELSDMLEILSKDFRDTSSITQLLNDNAGKAWSKWLENYEADLNENRGKDKGYAGKIIGSLRSNLAQSSLLLNAGVALKQAPSGLDFMTVLDADIVARRFATGFFRSARSYRNNPLIQTMEAYTKMLKNRQAGYNTVETGEATETGRKGFVNKLVDKLPSWMTNWITKTDFRTVANGLLACEDQVKRNIKDGLDGYKNLKEGTDAYYQKIADLFENAVMDTQPIYNKEYRADALRTDNEVLRILNMFRTQQTQNYNNLVETIGEYNAAKLSGDEEATKAARNRMGRTIAGQVSSAFVFAMLDAAAKMLMHKKKQYEDEDGNLSASIISQKVGWNFANSLASTSWLASKLSPFVINQMTKLANKATDGKVAKSDFYSGSLDGTLALVDDFASALDSFTTKPSLKTGKALALNLASLTGMPLKNGYNIVNAAIMHFYLDPSGKNVNNEDDIISYLDNYYKLSDESKAKQSVLRAISVNSKGNSEGADTIMATLNLDDDDIAKAAKQQLKDSFIAGDIDSMTYRNMLGKYFGMRQTEAWDLWKDVNEAKKFADTKARVFSSEEESKAFDKTMSKLTTTTDPTGKERFAEISRLGLNEEDTDTFVKKYMTESFSKNYDALRSIKIRPNDAARIVSSIDENESGNLSQDEVYDYLLTYPSSKKTVDALWKASGWKTSLDKYAEDYAKQPANILTSFGMSKAEAKRVAKQLNYDGKNDITQEDFFNYLKKHPDQEEALKAVFAAKWPKSDYESKKRKYG